MMKYFSETVALLKGLLIGAILGTIFIAVIFLAAGCIDTDEAMPHYKATQQK